MTNSVSFPVMFDIARNRVSVLSNQVSIANRCRLLFLSNPTELYNYPDFGVGLKKYLWQYNSENTKAIIRDRIISQLRTFEPDCDADKTSFADGLLISDNDANLLEQEYNTLKMTVGIWTVLETNVEVTVE